MRHLAGMSASVSTVLAVGRRERHLCFEVDVLRLKSVSSVFYATMRLYMTVLYSAMFSTNTC